MRARLLLVVALAAGVFAGGAPTAARAPAVVVSGGAGRIIARVPMPADGRFALHYRHSIYEEPGLETFAVRGDDRFELVKLSSPSRAVLDYYALAGDRGPRDGWYVLRPAREQVYRRLPLIATATGRRTLVVGERRIPLFGPGGARHLTICVRSGEGECG